MVEIKTPTTQEEFKDYFHLRWRILRKPWKQPEGSEKDEMEDLCIHLMAVEKEKVIGCCRIQMNNDKEAQVRYMAVDANMQGKGIGKKILLQAEKIAKNKGAVVLILEARENAVTFYKRCGYTITKKSYLLFDEIQHFTMHKHLSEETSL